MKIETKCPYNKAKSYQVTAIDLNTFLIEQFVSGNLTGQTQADAKQAFDIAGIVSGQLFQLQYDYAKKAIKAAIKEIKRREHIVSEAEEKRSNWECVNKATDEIKLKPHVSQRIDNHQEAINTLDDEIERCIKAVNVSKADFIDLVEPLAVAWEMYYPEDWMGETGKKLVVEGAGSEALGSVTNCRIRTKLVNDAGRSLYIELIGTEIHKYSTQDMKDTGWPLVGWLDHMYLLDEQGNDAGVYLCHRPKYFEWTEKGIVGFVNRSLNCSYSTLDIRTNDPACQVHESVKTIC